MLKYKMLFYFSFKNISSSKLKTGKISSLVYDEIDENVLGGSSVKTQSIGDSMMLRW